MSTNTKIKQDIQDLNVGSPLISLYSLDLTDFGGTIAYFTTGTLGGASVYFNTIEYLPLPVEATGFEWEGTGKLPRPVVTVSNITYAFLAEVVAYDDLVGARFTRRRTYKKYLDGQPEADPNAQYPADVFFVERKIKQNKFQVQWELAAAIDLERLYIPKRQCISICTYRYRWYDGGFQYDTNDPCPYTLESGDPGFQGYFDETGNACSAANDKCGKKLYDCELRYTSNGQIPGRFFPSVGNVGYPWRT